MRKFKPRPGYVVQAFKFALDPNRAQDAAMRSHCGGARMAYNWAVEWVTAAWWQRAAETSYGVSEEELTPWRGWSLPTLRKEFNRIKHTDPRFCEWWAENSKEAYNTGLAHAAAAFANYAASKSGSRKGPKMGRPRRKSKRRARLSCRFSYGARIRVEQDRRHITLPRIGTVRTHESTRKLERRIADGRARVLSATICHERGRWFCCLQVEVERVPATPVRPETAVGVDLGVKHLAVIAETSGQARYEPNPAHLDKALSQLRRLSRRVSRRRGPDRRTGQEPSRRWEKANAERNRVHHRVANLRRDALHKLTTGLACEYGHVVVEDLNVAGMLRNRRLARRIGDAGFAEIRRQLAYKTGWNGGALHVADRWFPSSKTCSACGAAKAKLALHVRVFDCDQCPVVLDRDENAARNLAALAAAYLDGTLDQLEDDVGECRTGTGVAGDRDARASKPRRADRKTRTQTAPGRKAGSGRAGGAKPAPSEAGKEARDRTQAEAPQLW
ncbi:IS607 family element RNA-guided endonuclease TnpB [Actinomadura sp. 6N118]|uniref:IS607 family element RNA-guided endonuclease TnpB n=1 Tax=Actinomadura sp. 6N118 TaxID=3375151 RepID=UPI003788DA03